MNRAAKAEQKLLHPKVDKLPRMSTPIGMRFAYIRGAANPHGRGFPGHVAEVDYDYQINCTRVAYAVEMRMRDYDVTAAKAGADANKSYAWNKANRIDPKTSKARSIKRAGSRWG